jgi:hypothetical protein
MPKMFRHWLLASCFCSLFAFAPAARAADPVSHLPSAPPTRVKLQLPTFLAFGLGAVSAGGAVATSFAAKRSNEPTNCDSRCTERAAGTEKRLLIATGVLSGMAAAGVGIGITLMLKAPKDPRRDAIRPRFDLGLSAQKAVAKVGWVF